MTTPLMLLEPPFLELSFYKKADDPEMLLSAIEGCLGYFRCGPPDLSSNDGLRNLFHSDASLVPCVSRIDPPLRPGGADRVVSLWLSGSEFSMPNPTRAAMKRGTRIAGLMATAADHCLVDYASIGGAAQLERPVELSENSSSYALFDCYLNERIYSAVKPGLKELNEPGVIERALANGVFISSSSYFSGLETHARQECRYRIASFIGKVIPSLL
jgi:hypothetical protein